MTNSKNTFETVDETIKSMDENDVGFVLYNVEFVVNLAMCKWLMGLKSFAGGITYERIPFSVMFFQRPWKGWVEFEPLKLIIELFAYPSILDYTSKRWWSYILLW